MGKYYCTREDVEILLGDAMPEDANRNDVLDAVRTAHDRVANVVENADVTRVDGEVMAGRVNLATSALAAHRLLMRSGIMDLDIRTRKRQAIVLLERIQNGEYAADEEPDEADTEEPVEGDDEEPVEGEDEEGGE